MLVGFALPQQAAAQNSSDLYGATWTISDADPVDEGGTAAFEITLSRAIGFSFSASVTYTAESAALTDLGSTRPNAVAINTTGTTYTLEVPIENDALAEGEETFTVSVEIGTLNDAAILITATGTINASDGGGSPPPAAVAPQITTQPTDQSVTVGGSATFTVTATGTPTPTYQWRFDGSDISGATSASYTISSAALTNAGDYTVVVTNTTGTVTSTAATLTVTAAAVAPQITTQPTDQSVTVGASATFTVTATGTPTPTYQWRFDGSDIDGATSASYTISSATLTNAGSYTVVVTNTAGAVTSSAATLTVTAAAVAPQITTQPTDQSVTVGENATFTVAATGTPTPTYQWRFDGSDISGATSATYTLSNAALTNAGDYTVVVTNTAGTVTSSAATLTVTVAPVAPQITTQPTGQSVTVGENATFTVAATGTPTPTYQWHFDGTAIVGATSASYALSNAALTNAGDYTVVVTNTAGTVTSNAATLTVTAATVAPQITTQPVNQSVTVGDEATFTVAATGTPTPTYQWHFDGTAIVGATSASYTLSNAALTNAGDYTVVVTNTAGTVTSNAATLTVTPATVAPQITTQPTDQSVTVGDNATFTVAATGTPTPTYQWRFEGSDISGATSETYTLSNAALTNAGDYTVVVTNTAGTVTSSAATLTVTAVVEATVSIAAASAVENVSGGNAEFTVSLTTAVNEDVVLAVAYAVGVTNPVVLATDLGTRPNTVTIDQGQTSATLLVPIIDDSIVESDETFTVTISEGTTSLPDGVTIGTSDTATGTITNDDTAVLGFTGSSSFVPNEGLTFTTTVSFLSSGASSAAVPVTLTWTAVPSTSTRRDPGEPEDLDPSSGTVTIPAGQSSADITITAFDDTDDEPFSEELFIQLGLSTTSPLPPDVSLVASSDAAYQRLVRVGDNDDAPDITVSIGDISVAENVSGGNAQFTITLSETLIDSITFSLTFEPGDTNPVVLADDLGDVRDVFAFSGGNLTGTFNVPIINDELVEGDETFTITIAHNSGGGGSNVTFTKNKATGTIVDDDDPPPPEATVSIGNASVAENDGNAEFTVSLTQAVESDVTLAVAYAAGTATLATDLGTRPTTVTIDQGNTEATLEVPVTNDNIVEGNEDFTVTISEGTTALPEGVTIGTAATATGTITDNDLAEITLGPATLEAVENGTFTYTVSLSKAVDEAVTVRWTATDGTAIVADDLQAITNTVTFPANDNTALEFTISPVDDPDDEVNETFTVTLEVDTAGGNPLPTGVTIGTNNSSTATITDNDVAPAITTQPVNQSVTVGDSATFTVVASGASLNYQWRKDGTAIAGATSATYAISNAALTDAGDYTVVVTNTAGTVTSTAATLTVTAAAPDLTVDSVTVSSASVVESAPFTINATVNNEGNAASAATTLTYYRSADATITTDDTSIATDAVGILAASGSSTQNASVSIATADTYYVGACVPTVSGETNTNNNCSTGVQVTVTAAPVAPAITTQPTDQSVTVGENATFTVAATGTPTPTYQWRFEGSDISGATSETYTLSNAALTNAGDYTVVVTNTAGTVTSNAATLTVTPAAVAPQITTQPTDQSVTVGENATFTVAATGTPTPTYQWHFDGTAIVGATSASYTLSNAALTNAGDYTVVVTNTAGTVTSNAATLTVTAAAVAPQITTQPTDQSVTVGENATFTVAATGTPTPTYQWRFEGSDISGATSASYTLSNAALTNAGDYTVVVTNTAGTVTSTAATLTVTAAAVAPQITTQPTDQSVTVGENATFTVAATGTPTPTYQWRFEGSDIAGATSASYTLSSAALTNAGDYTVVVTNTAGTVTSTAATLTVTAVAPSGPDLTVDSVSVSSASVVEGASFTINATVNNEGNAASAATTLTYYRSADATITTGDTSIGTDPIGILAASGSSPENISVSIATADTYYVGACVPTVSGETNTNNNCSTGVQVTVTATVAPGITTQPTDQSVTVGGSATFTVVASGTPTPTYQWRKDGTDIAGATSASYTLSGAALTDAGSYTVVVTNSTSAVTSTAATLTVTAAPVAPPTVNISIAAASATEGDNIRFTVTLSTELLEPRTINIGYTAGSGGTGASLDDLGSDRPATLTLPTGTTNVDLNVPTVNDSDDEDNETFTVTLSLPAAPTNPRNTLNITTSTATGTINDNDDTPDARVSIANASVAENAATGAIGFTVSLDRAVDSDVTLAVAYAADTATLGTDLGTRPATVTIDQGATEATLTVPVTNDAIVEGNETFTVTISEGTTPLPDDVNIGTNQATGTITDADGAGVSLRSTAVAPAAEGGTITFTVDLDNPVAERFSLGWTASNGTATVADDLDDQTGTVEIAANTRTATFTIAVTNDQDTEGSEAFTVALTGAPTGLVRIAPSRVTVDRSPSIGTINASDAQGENAVSIGNSTVAENVSGGSADFTVSLNRAVDSDVVLAVTYAPGTTNPVTLADDLGSDRPTTVTITEGQTSTTLRVPIIDDDIVEDNETFTVMLGVAEGSSLPTGVTISNARAIGTITDNDSSTASIDPLASPLGQSLAFTAALSNPVAEDVVLTWTATVDPGDSTSPGSEARGTASALAESGEDSGTVTIIAGSRSARFMVDTTGLSPGQTVTVTLSDPNNTLPGGVNISQMAGRATANVAVHSELIDPRRSAALSVLRHHVSRFERITSSAVHNRLDGSGHGNGFGLSEDLGSGNVVRGTVSDDHLWGAWANASFTGFDGESTGRQVEVYTGIDYLSDSGKVVIGTLLGVESTRLDVGEGEADYESEFLQFGVYGGVRLAENLIWDGAFGYGTSRPGIAQDDVFATYDAQRITLRNQLTGSYDLLSSGRLKLSPQLGVLYARERISDFTDSAGNTGAQEVLEIGRISAGPSLTWQPHQGREVEFGVRLHWDVLNSESGREREVSGSADLGIRFPVTSKLKMGVFIEADGLGITDEFATYGGRIEIRSTY